MMNDICEHLTGETTGTNCMEAKKSLEEVIPLLGKIPEQRGECNVVRVKPITQLDIDHRCMKAVRCWIGVSKKEGNECTYAVCDFMAENTTTEAFDALDSKLMIKKMLGEKRKRSYDVS
eukprot:13193816-Ditylum_brightwellii.AAC.1